MATKDLFALIREGDGSQIGEYIKNLRDLTAVEAALNSDPALVGLVGGRYKWTALHNAVRYGHFQLVLLLLTKGAKVDAKDSRGATALHCACSGGHLEVTKELLTQGADIESTNEFNSTPMDYCASGIQRDLERFIKAELPARRKEFLEKEQRKRIDTISSPAVVKSGSFWTFWSTPPAPVVSPSQPPADMILLPSSILLQQPPTVRAPAAPPSPPIDDEIIELRTRLETMTQERDAATTTITALSTSLTERTRERDVATTTITLLNLSLNERTRERDAAAITITTLNTSLSERTRERGERGAATTTITALNTSLSERTRERDEATTTITVLNTNLSDRTRERDTVMVERDMAVMERNTVMAERVGLLQELEEWRTGIRVLAEDEAFVRYRPYVHRGLPVPQGYRGVRLPLPATTALHRLVAGLCRTRGSYYPNPRPVAGFTLVRVEAVVSDDLKVAIFDNYLGRMRRLRENIAAYNADTGLLSGPQMRVLNAVREEYHERSPERSPLEARTLYVFHGPRVGAVDGICLDGLEAVRSLDPGYFGAGAYTSLNVEYAARYARGEFDAQPLQRDFSATGGLVPVIMFAAAVNMAYPVTLEVDYPQPPRADRHSRFFGQPLSAGFDSHVACVSERAGFEAVQREHCEYVELVVANYQQLLPLAVLWLQPM